jgi:hypothetical protein
MIAYLVMAGKSPVALVNQLVARLREGDPSCRVAVIDAPEHRLARRPECDVYRTRATSGSAWEDERAALAMLAHEFRGVRWIGRIHHPDRIPALPHHLESLDCWICPNGYFLRCSFLNTVVRSVETVPATGLLIENRIYDLVAAAGGRAARKPDEGSGDEGYFSTPVLATAMPMRARAFCAVATVEVVDEVEILVRTLRRHHAEPLVLVCDEGVAERISALALPRIEIEPITDELRARAEQLSLRVFRHDPYWKPEAIALKFHALRIAIHRHGPSHLLDADIAVNASLHTGGPWMADLVLSPFYWPDPAANTPVAHGFFNGGYLLVRDTRIVNRWEQMYATGLGGFYEQKCLDYLGREFVTAWFGHEHNFAKWRWESPRRRPVASLHHKLRAKGKAPRILETSDAVMAAVRNTQAPSKIAHIHCVRSWGTHLRALFRERIGPALGLQNLVSWDLDLDREWTEEELLLLAEGTLWGQHPGGCAFVHNHTFGWTERALDAFHENDWLTVALVRDPREVLVSLAAWSLDAMKRGQPCPVWHREGLDNRALASARSIKEAVLVLLNDPIYHPQWVLPTWLEKVRWIRRASPEAIRELCCEVCGQPEVPDAGERNESSSPGWKSARLSAGVRKLVNAHPEVRAWDEFLSGL